MSDTKKIHVYQAEDGWRWRKIVSSDETADSGEAYPTRSHAIRAATAEAGDEFEVVVDE